ncbi:ABC transporter permease [Pseudonocardia humida]|uniref:ABC transporter permease n=1 Tax=Pseudonocardia humida TaxID=2800819 RepID=UPI00207D02D1|nr:ABC transporter permease [Pseudonocardia humida]
MIAEFRVGRPKANAVLAALRESGFDPSTGAATQATLALDVVPVRQDKPTPSGSSPVGGWSAEQISTPDRTSSETGHPAPMGRGSRLGSWPLVLIALGAFVSIWGGWVGLGELTGFGPIQLLPGIADQVVINSAITLPIGVEAYAAFALRTWLAPDIGLSSVARRFARWSAIGSLALGAAGQIAYHLMVAAGVSEAPWPITAFVSCLPVVVLGCAAALTHLIHRFDDTLGVQR